MSPDDKEQFKHWVKGLLHEGTVRVAFTKADGSERIMQCTLQESSIPADKIPKGVRTVTSEETQRVFDTEKQEWRSFHWDSVKAVEFNI